ncbi:MAG: type II secretion system F family protein, partial [Solirubrobacterales bacterium]
MSTFAFRAVDVAGVPSRGELDAETKAHVTEQLRAKGLIVLDVSEQKEAFRLEELVSGGIKMREMAVFARQFATLIAAGMPMLRSLYTLEDQTDDERLKEAIVGLRKDVEAGSSVADAMDRQPKVFDQLFRSMVRSGEGSGRLEDVLERVAFHLEKLDALRRQIRAAMLYPSFVFALALVVMLAVVAFIVPVFAGVFEEIAADTPGEDASLPLLTRITVGASNLVTGYWYILLPVLIAVTVGFFQWKKTDAGRVQWDRIKLRIPFKIG